MSAGTTVAWILLLASAGTAHATERYTLDSTNTQVSFVIQHLGLQWVSARFPDINGELVLDRGGAQQPRGCHRGNCIPPVQRGALE